MIFLSFKILFDIKILFNNAQHDALNVKTGSLLIYNTEPLVFMSAIKSTSLIDYFSPGFYLKIKVHITTKINESSLFDCDKKY